MRYDQSAAGTDAIADPAGNKVADFTTGSGGVPAVANNSAVIPPLEVTLRLSHDRILEFPSPVTVTATVSPASPVAFTVTISATPVAPATAADFRLSTNRVLRFAADATESTGTVTITPADDDVPEPHDVVRVSGAVSNAAIPDPDDVTVEIINNDPEDYDVEVSAPPAVDEGAGAAVVTLTLTTQKNTAPVATVDMFFDVEGGTATRGDDYTPPPGRDFGITGIHFASVQPSAFSPNAAGTAWVAEPSFTIGIIDDREAELAETIVFRVKFSEVETPAHTITIHDNDAVAPGRPTGLQAAPRSPTVIQLSWTAPEYVGSFSITAGYRGRGLRERERALERRRRRHPQHPPQLGPWRAVGRRHAALPGVGDQPRGHVGPLERRVRHRHCRGSGRDERRAPAAAGRECGAQTARRDSPELVEKPRRPIA